MEQRMMRTLAAAAVLAPQAALAAVVVDDFTSGEGAVVVNSDTTAGELVQTGLEPASTLLGRRKISLSWGFFDAQAYAVSAGVATAGGGSFFHDGSAGPPWGSEGDSVGVLRLELGDPNASAGLTEDLTVGGMHTLRIAVEDSTLRNTNVNATSFDFRVTVTSASGSKLVTVNVPQSALQQAIDLPFASFTGMDFSQVKAINLDAFNVTSGGALTIGSISAVPEPAAGALLALAGLALVGRVRR